MKVIIVASGKGGTGKSTVTSMVGITLAEMGYNVALLDLDTSGPNLSKLIGVEPEDVIFDEFYFYPKKKGRIEIFSPSFLIPNGVACGWSGEKRMDLIHELILKVKWGENIDVMICDAPPGTGDELNTVLTHIKDISGVVIVTTGSRASIDDAKRLVSLLNSERYKTPILGVVENMGTRLAGNNKAVPMFSDDLNIKGELGCEVISKISYKDKIKAQDYEQLAKYLVEHIPLGKKEKEENL